MHLIPRFTGLVQQAGFLAYSSDKLITPSHEPVRSGFVIILAVHSSGPAPDSHRLPFWAVDTAFRQPNDTSPQHVTMSRSEGPSTAQVILSTSRHGVRCTVPHVSGHGILKRPESLRPSAAIAEVATCPASARAGRGRILRQGLAGRLLCRRHRWRRPCLH